MSDQLPGAFPSTPSCQNKIFEQKTPTATDFKFTPLSSMSGVKKQLYPNISHLKGGNNDDDDLARSIKEKGYSSNISTKVLSELNQRAASKNSHLQNKSSVLSPRSSRYNTSHRSRFQKMDSISSHYAASTRRNQVQARMDSMSKPINRQELEQDKENIPSYDPNSKRSGNSDIASAAKRRKTEVGVKEVRSSYKPTLTPSKKETNLQKILNSLPSAPKEIKETKTLKTKPSISQFSKPKPNIPSSTSTKTLRESRSISHLPKTLTKPTASSQLRASASIANLKQPQQTLRHTTSTRTLPKSTTLSNLTKPTASSISRSSSTVNNLNHQLTSKPSREALSTSRIPRSKSIMNDKSRPLWR
ncbi:hypothetical protein BN7_774 [Wickerhamomyces ciferrii]|uniref:Uncharacterized protein n=1 Tax=Wickerhamomyces ciferrii (strain ATCC 14091 / BCRC 22168 / CBS 111 / JCM 3599 / NBRC 0793 / NRRL Y-1031 F-60-10) TaxID=1206466 RepID=K0KGC8_WICCF|nr:uncharacterized protein BN7_774 [Wickerhamomyces ciferrii]CCH41237.1 hypothetical protein BN7_774 [Wickerhamomyces ciferrii]